MNFHTVVPYLEMITRNGLADVVEGTMVRYRTTAKGEAALRCMRELENRKTLWVTSYQWHRGLEAKN
jgi:hypothetical protein